LASGIEPEGEEEEITAPWFFSWNFFGNLDELIANMLLKTTIGALALLLGTAANAARPYGFGKVVTLGKHDRLVQHESLRVLTSEVVGFVHYQQGRKMSGAMDNPSSFKILEDGKPMTGHKVLGSFVKLHHMGHLPG